MLKEWFEVKVKYWKNTEEKDSKEVTEVFLFDAVSWTDAEVRTAEELAEFAKAGYTVKSIGKKKVTEVLAFEEGEYWFDCGVEMVVFSEGDSKEKKTKLNYLVMADDIVQANYRVFECLEDSVSPFRIISLSESNILEVFVYDKKTTKEKNLDLEVKILGLNNLNKEILKEL